MLSFENFESARFFKFNNLADAHVKHFISSRIGGVSEGELGGLNLSFKVGDLDSNVQHNRSLLSRYMGVEEENLVFPVQTHGSKVVNVLSKLPASALECTDAVITNQRGVCIAVMSADCVPVLLYDPVKKAAAAIHAGWRGTVADIVGKTVAEMVVNYGTNPADLLAGIGPSISPEIYEVGEEVIAAVNALMGVASTDGILRFHLAHQRNAMLNLWELNRQLLIRAGLSVDHIEVSAVCTFKHNELFFSARHSKNTAGRFAAGILLN